MSRILLIKFGAIGDVIMLIPAAHQLHLAGHQVDWVCSPAVLPILQLYPWIDPIVADDRSILSGSIPARLASIAKLWRALAGRRYLLVATLYYDPRYRLLALPVRATKKIQLSWTDRDRRILPGRRHTDEFSRILAVTLDPSRQDGVNPTHLPPMPPPLLPKRAFAGTRIILAPAGARNMLAEATLRRWPVENYVTLARLLLEQVPGVEIVLLGGPDDTWAQPLFAELPVTDLIGKLSLVENIALLDTAEVFVTHDTGPLHLAGLTGCGIVALFGPTDPHMFLPQRPGAVALWGGEGFACRPCYDGHSFAPCPANDCMRQLTPQMVHSEVLAMLADRERGVLAPPRVWLPPSTIDGGELIRIGNV